MIGAIGNHNLVGWIRARADACEYELATCCEGVEDVKGDGRSARVNIRLHDNVEQDDLKYKEHISNNLSWRGCLMKSVYCRVTTHYYTVFIINILN